MYLPMSFDEIVEMLIRRMSRNGLDFDKQLGSIPGLSDDFLLTVQMCGERKKHNCDEGDIYIPLALIVPAGVIQYRDAFVANPRPMRRRSTLKHQSYWLPDIVVRHKAPDDDTEHSALTFNECACVYAQNPWIRSIRAMSDPHCPCQIYSHPDDARHIVADNHGRYDHHGAYVMKKRTDVPEPFIENLEEC